MATHRELLFPPMTTSNALCILILLLLSVYHSSADITSDICKSTPNPSYCKSILPSNNPSATVFDYGRFSIQKSRTSALAFYNLIQKYLSKKPDQLTSGAIAALEDCLYLADLNINFLSDTSTLVNKTSSKLPITQAEYTHSILSAILTNMQTCMNGIEEVASSWSLKGDITSPLSINSKLFSISLALFTQAWLPGKKTPLPRPGKGQLGSNKGKGNGQLNLQMSGKNQAKFDFFRNKYGNGKKGQRRRLLTVGEEVVAIYDLVVVCQDGTGDYKTINEAVTTAPVNLDETSGYYMIYITAGTYPEYVSISGSNTYLLMVGDGINQTIITGNHNVVDGWTTFNSFTFAVVAKGFFAVNITFQNTAGPSKHQAVAVRNGADSSTFYSCSFEGYQDTLYAHSMRQFYRDCDIYGTVDYIFGNAAAVFQNCNLYAQLPNQGQFNALTAQGRADPNQNTGSSFQNCNVTATPELATNTNYTVKTYLGRPWKEYSRTIFMQSFLDSLIDPAGWSIWSGDFALNTSFFAEFNNTGPGSDTSQRANWTYVINATIANSFTVESFLLGDVWLPQTGVPYKSGLYDTTT